MQHLLQFAIFKSNLEKVDQAIDAHPPLHYPGEGKEALEFQAKNGATWGQWRLVLNAIWEFIDWYRSVDFSFEVRIFNEGGQGKDLGDGYLWTGV